MRCGALSAEDCITDHICPPLAGRATRPGQWSARCPGCGGARRLSITVKNGRIVWCCHRDPACSTEEIRNALALLLPACVTRTRAPRAGIPRQIDRDALVELASRDLPAAALRVGMLRLAGFSAVKARAELGMAKSTYYDALRQLGR